MVYVQGHDMKAENERVNWKSVLLYYVIACAVSFPFFWWRDIHPESWTSWKIPDFLKPMTYMWGPGIAALISLIIFHKSHQRAITFFGTSAFRSAAFYLVPVLALSVIYAPEILQGDPLWMLTRLIIIGFISILGEELGWRGFLQDALRPLSKAKRYALIAVMWELWHFTNRTHNGTAQHNHYSGKSLYSNFVRTFLDLRRGC